MKNGGLRKIDGLVELMNPAGEVGIFGIQEKALIEQSDFLKGFGSQKHETSRQKGNVHNFIIPRNMHFILPVFFLQCIRKEIKEPSEN